MRNSKEKKETKETINNLRSILIIIIAVASMQSIRSKHSAIFKCLGHWFWVFLNPRINKRKNSPRKKKNENLSFSNQKSLLHRKMKRRTRTNKATRERKNYRKLFIEIFGFIFASLVSCRSWMPAQIRFVVSIKCITGHSRNCWKNG